jgi:hypothetical protein
MIVETFSTLSKLAVEANKNFVKVNHQLLNDTIEMIEDLKRKVNAFDIYNQTLKDRVADLEGQLKKFTGL